MCMVDPRLVSEASGGPVCSVAGKCVSGKVCFPDQYVGLSVVKSVPICVLRRMAVWHSGTTRSRRDPTEIQPGIIISALPELEYGTLLQGYDTVLQPVSVHPSWMCVDAFPDATCHPALLREIVDCFPDNI